MTRTEQLNAIFAQALELTYDFHRPAFADADIEHVKSRLRADMTKIEITRELRLAGVTNAEHIAQVILTMGNRLDSAPRATFSVR